MEARVSRARRVGQPGAPPGQRLRGAARGAGDSALARGRSARFGREQAGQRVGQRAGARAARAVSLRRQPARRRAVALARQTHGHARVERALAVVRARPAQARRAARPAPALERRRGPRAELPARARVRSRARDHRARARGRARAAPQARTDRRGAREPGRRPWHAGRRARALARAVGPALGARARPRAVGALAVGWRHPLGDHLHRLHAGAAAAARARGLRLRVVGLGRLVRQRLPAGDGLARAAGAHGPRQRPPAHARRRLQRRGDLSAARQEPLSGAWHRAHRRLQHGAPGDVVSDLADSALVVAGLRAGDARLSRQAGRPAAAPGGGRTDCTRRRECLVSHAAGPRHTSLPATPAASARRRPQPGRERALARAGVFGRTSLVARPTWLARARASRGQAVGARAGRLRAACCSRWRCPCSCRSC